MRDELTNAIPPAAAVPVRNVDGIGQNAGFELLTLPAIGEAR
jgi:hypothetical protein